MPIATINPATGETIKTFEALDSQQLEAKLQRAAETFRSYRNTSFADRAERGCFAPPRFWKLRKTTSRE